MTTSLRVYDSRFQFDAGPSDSLALSSSFSVAPTAAAAAVDLSTGWRDMIGQISPPDTSAGNPGRIAVGGSDFTAYRFLIGERVWIEYHINHDYKLGTPVFERVTNGATDNTNNIFVLEVDCHYQTNRLATLNRTPDFDA